MDIVSRDTIHNDDINKSFHDAIIKNYQTILSEQRALCGVKKHQFKLADMKPIARVDKTKPVPVYKEFTQLGYTVGDSLVDYSKRYNFYSHNIDDVLLTQEDISSDKYSSVFQYNFMVFINGYYIDDVMALTDDNDTTFVINVTDNAGITGTQYNEFVKHDAVVTVYIVPNFKIAKLTTTMATFKRNDCKLNSKNIPNMAYSENTLVFINEQPYTNFGIRTLANYTLVDSGNIQVDTTWLSNHVVSTVKITVLEIPKFKLLKDVRFSKDNQPYFNIPGVDALIPSDNILIIPYNDTVPNELTNPTKIELKMFYPNIYKYEYKDADNWDSVGLLGYFHDESELTTYDNKLKLFYKYIPNIIEAYTNESISEYVRDFVPVDVKYYNELYTDTIHAPYTFAYKVDKFHEYVNLDPELLINYLYTKLRGKMRHYVYMNKLDLTSRIRMNNNNERVPYNVDKKEFGDSFHEAIFGEPHYVFSLSKAVFGPEEEFRFFLDNKALLQFDYYIQDDVDWYHVYIPCSKVTNESVLEIEKFPKVEETIIFSPDDTANGEIDFKMPQGMTHIYMNTMHLYDANSSEYLTTSDFEVVVYDETTKENITLVPGSRASIKHGAKIRILNPVFYGSTISMYIRTHPAYGRYDNEKRGMCYFNDNVNVSKQHIRPFKNGVFLNPETFLRFSRLTKNIFNSEATMFINASYEDGDMIGYDILPFKNHRELTVDGVFCTEKGFVDTGDALTLPIDLKWYDVYVNGRKLNKTNIEIISPNKFFVKGIDSRKNLEIWLRGDAPQELDFYNYDNTINDVIWNKDDFIRDAIINSQDILDDTLSDIFDEFAVNVLDQYKDFVKRILEYSFINPNKMQLTPDMEEWYPDLFDEHSIMYLDSNTHTDAEFKTFINSNKRYEEMKNGQYRYGFTPMHIGSHEDALPGEYMCDPLTGLPGIKNETDETIIPGGSISRVVAHENIFTTELTNIGMSRTDIYQLQFNENVTSKLIAPNTSVLDDNSGVLIETNVPEKICFSLDLDIMAADSQNVMGLVECDPTVVIDYNYLVGGIQAEEHIECKLSALRRSPVTTSTGNDVTNFTISNISIIENPDSAPDLSGVKMILHSILMAF